MRLIQFFSLTILGVLLTGCVSDPAGEDILAGSRAIADFESEDTSANRAGVPSAVAQALMPGVGSSLGEYDPS